MDCGSCRPALLLILSVAATVVVAQGAGSISDDRRDLQQLVEDRFRRWDRNRDRRLSPEEVNLLVADRDIRDEEAAAVAAIKRYWRSGAEVRALSQDQLLYLIAQRNTARNADLVVMFAEGLQQIRGSSSRLFASRRPRLETVQQGKLGNCFVLAPLGAVLQASPDRVIRMFIEQANGRYGVRLGGRVMQVDAPTDAERAQTAGNEGDGVWVNVFEKAIGSALQVRRSVSGSSLDTIAGGGSATEILELITGNRVQVFLLDGALQVRAGDRDSDRVDQQLREFLRDTLADARAAVCTTRTVATPGLPGNHAYAVISFDYRRDEITLWNPHGGSFTPRGSSGPKSGYSMRKGIFSLPLVEFRQLFEELAAESNRSARTSRPLPDLP